MKSGVRSLLWGLGIVALCAVLLFGGSALVQAVHKPGPAAVPAPPSVRLPAGWPSKFVLPDDFALNSVQKCDASSKSGNTVAKACRGISGTEFVAVYEAVSFNMETPAGDIAAQAANSLRQHGWAVGHVGRFVAQGEVSFARPGWDGALYFEVPESTLSSVEVDAEVILRPTTAR